ncbi:MAG: T9SS type A sorting domain-containing protein [Ferruginibacter sp.]
MADSFIADSAYQFLVIGNFYDNVYSSVFDCDTAHVDGAYYLVDAVCVSLDSLTCYNWTGINEVSKKNFSLYPNPAYEKLYVKNLTYDVSYSIFNSMGAIARTGILTKQSNVINISSFENGLYLFSINNNYYNKFLIIH